MSTLHRLTRVGLVPTLALALLAVASVSARAQTPATLKWGPAPAVFAHGAKMAVVSGDPMKSGKFTAQLSMPSGYRIKPHWHPTDEHVVVKQGSLVVGMGDAMNKAAIKAAKTLKVGESSDLTANTHHFAMAKGRTVIEVTADGPFVLNYVNPKDDPQQHKAAKVKAKA
jgi:hypothetical protein